MKIELNIGDERPEAQFLRKHGDPSAYLLELVRRDQECLPPPYEGIAPGYATLFPSGIDVSFHSRAEAARYLDEL